jgi:hypothetical protein
MAPQDTDRGRLVHARYVGSSRTYFEEFRATLGGRVDTFAAVALRAYSNATSPEHAISLAWTRAEPSLRGSASDHVINWSRAERAAETLLRSVDCLRWLEKAIDTVHHEIIDNVRAGWRCPTAIHSDTHERFTLDPFLLETEGLDRVENLIRSGPHTLLDLRFFDPQSAPDSVITQSDPATQPALSSTTQPAPDPATRPARLSKYEKEKRQFFAVQSAAGVRMGGRSPDRMTWPKLARLCHEHCRAPRNARGFSVSQIRDDVKTYQPEMLLRPTERLESAADRRSG